MSVPTNNKYLRNLLLWVRIRGVPLGETFNYLRCYADRTNPYRIYATTTTGH